VRWPGLSGPRHLRRIPPYVGGEITWSRIINSGDAVSELPEMLRPDDAVLLVNALLSLVMV
jgi:hypothetical protein